MLTRYILKPVEHLRCALPALKIKITLEIQRWMSDGGKITSNEIILEGF